MPKPRGGRGKSAPYTTRHVRVPEPIVSQVNALIELYQAYLEEDRDTNTPPDFLNQKPVNKFLEKREEIITVLEEALKLKANAGGAIKEKIKEVLHILKSL